MELRKAFYWKPLNLGIQKETYKGKADFENVGERGGNDRCQVPESFRSKEELTFTAAGMRGSQITYRKDELYT